MRLTDACIRRPVLAWMIMGAVVLLGLLSFKRIGVSQFPDVDSPIISVSVDWEGAAPAVVEKDVVEVLEDYLSQVEGVKGIRSTARQGGASLSLEFNLDRDIDLALQDTQAKISHAGRRLPKDIDPPVITKSNPEDFPIMWLGLYGPYARQELSDYVRYRIRDRLQLIPGIGEVVMGGSLDRNIRIWLDANKLNAMGVTVAEVTNALHRQHVELPAGQLISGGRETNVRVMGEAINLATIRSLPVAHHQGTPVTLEQVALVEDGFEDFRRLTRVDGFTAQGIGIKKQRGANSVAVASGVREAVEEIRKSLPKDMEFSISFDASIFINESVHEMQFEIILAVILTALMCWFFLGSLSSTINVLLAIPMSLLGTIAVLYFLGFTLNTFTLLGLGLAVGLVVDDAIMVMENITRHRQAGADRITAAKKGTREISFAALASSVAVIAVFSPVLFMDGMVGKFFLQFGLALCIAVMLSYIEAVTLAPARCAQFLGAPEERHSLIGRFAEVSFAWMERTYAAVLKRTIRYPWLVLGSSLLIAAGCIGVLGSIPREMVPAQDQSRMQIRITTPVGSSMQETDQLVRKAEAIVIARPEVTKTFCYVGSFSGNSTNSAFFFVTLAPQDQRAKSQAQIQNELRRELAVIPGLRAMIQDPSQQTFTAQRGFPVEVSLRGPDWDGLLENSRKLMGELQRSGMVVDLDSDTDLAMPELRITPDRARCADLGVSIEDVATSLNALVGGVLVGKYSSGERRMDMRVRLLSEQRTRPEDLQNLRIRTRSGDLVPLSALVTVEERPAMQDIRRANRQRAIGINANIAPGHSQQEALALVERLGQDMLPPGYQVVMTGASASYRDSTSNLLFAALFGILAAYMVLGAQFNSFLHPLTVLSVMPLSAAGAILALWLGGQSLNIFSIIGLLLLLGIAKKNSIMLVDYANQLRERGEASDATSAMLGAGPVRLRPILMTSGATALAAVPLALSLGPGGEVRAPMAIAVIGGVILSTALSLVVVPAVYLLMDRFLALFRRSTAGKPATPTAVQPKPLSSDPGLG
jgi:multidrug efflux pump